MKVLIEISEDDYRYIRNKGARIPYKHLTTAIAKGRVIDEDINGYPNIKEYSEGEIREAYNSGYSTGLDQGEEINNSKWKEAIEKINEDIEHIACDFHDCKLLVKVERSIDKHTKDLIEKG